MSRGTYSRKRQQSHNRLFLWHGALCTFSYLIECTLLNNWTYGQVQQKGECSLSPDRLLMGRFNYKGGSYLSPARLLMGMFNQQEVSIWHAHLLMVRSNKQEMCPLRLTISPGGAINLETRIRIYLIKQQLMGQVFGVAAYLSPLIGQCYLLAYTGHRSGMLVRNDMPLRLLR